MIQKLNWGIASAGKISHDFVNAIGLITHQNHEVVAVAARDQESAKQFAQNFGIKRAYGGYDELAKDEEIDVVYVGAIHTSHFKISKMLIDAGKSVLCEKPLCMNVKETKELINHAKAKKVFLMEAIWSRCQPTYEKLRNCLTSGEIGQPVQAVVNFGQKISNIARLNTKALGGGSVLDIGVYCVQFATLAFGFNEKPEKIVATGVLNEDGVDLAVSCSLLYKGDRIATLITDTRANLDCKATVYGTEGSVTIHSPFWCSDTITTPSGVFKYETKADAKHPFKFVQSEGLQYEAAHVFDCLNKGLTESPNLTLNETLAIAELMENIRMQVGVKYDQD